MLEGGHYFHRHHAAEQRQRMWRHPSQCLLKETSFSHNLKPFRAIRVPSIENTVKIYQQKIQTQITSCLQNNAIKIFFSSVSHTGETEDLTIWSRNYSFFKGTILVKAQNSQKKNTKFICESQLTATPYRLQKVLYMLNIFTRSIQMDIMKDTFCFN